jgi:hypothetical protein
VAVKTQTIRLHRAQAKFRRSKATYRGFVGGRSAGKSWVGAYDLIRRAKRGRTYLVASPTGVLLGDTTFPTFKQIAQELGVWGGVKLTPYPNAYLTTGATIRFRTAEDPERLRGPNLSGAWLDEGSLMAKAVFDITIACLREQGEQGWLSATFTPKGVAHWTYQVFGKFPLRPNTELFHARTCDNPFNPPAFYETLKEQYESGFAEQELEGRFVDAFDIWQVIPTAWVEAAFERWRTMPDPRKGGTTLRLDALGVDPARGGEDRTAIAPRWGNWFAPLIKIPGRLSPTGAEVAAAVYKEYIPSAAIVVDILGTAGGGTYEALRSYPIEDPIIQVNNSEGTNVRSRDDMYRLVNVRAASYWKLREDLNPDNGENLALPPDLELLAELCASRYKLTASGIQVELKEEIKKRLGRSVDLADAVVLANWWRGLPAAAAGVFSGEAWNPWARRPKPLPKT